MHNFDLLVLRALALGKPGPVQRWREEKRRSSTAGSVGGFVFKPPPVLVIASAAALWLISFILRQSATAVSKTGRRGMIETCGKSTERYIDFPPLCDTDTRSCSVCIACLQSRRVDLSRGSTKIVVCYECWWVCWRFRTARQEASAGHLVGTREIRVMSTMTTEAPWIAVGSPEEAQPVDEAKTAGEGVGMIAGDNHHQTNTTSMAIRSEMEFKKAGQKKEW